MKINLVWPGHPFHEPIIYQNNNGIVQFVYGYRPDEINIGVGRDAMERHPEARLNDSLLILEPVCTFGRDYDVEYIKNFKWIFTWASKVLKQSPLLESKTIEINHPSCYGVKIGSELIDGWIPWEQRSNEVVFIANNKSSDHNSELYSVRTMIADYLHQEGIKVSWYGQTPLRKPYYKGKAESKYEILRKVKFSVCLENSYDKRFSYNYFTEKLPEVWMAGAVPIYIGCHNINDFKLTPNSYIDLRKFYHHSNKKHLLDFNLLRVIIQNYNKNTYNEYIKSIKSLLETGKLQDMISWERVGKTMLDTFSAV
jgi:hypothetical protein